MLADAEAVAKEVRTDPEKELGILRPLASARIQGTPEVRIRSSLTVVVLQEPAETLLLPFHPAQNPRGQRFCSAAEEILERLLHQRLELVFVLGHIRFRGVLAQTVE